MAIAKKPEEVQKIKNIITGTGALKIRSQTGTKFIVETDVDRPVGQQILEQTLTKFDYTFSRKVVSGSGFPATIITQNGFVIIYKNNVGGLAETTLNSSITELFPCIAFHADIRERNDIEKFYRQIVESNSPNLPCYIGRSYEAGKRFVDGAEKSTKFRQKIKAAFAVLKFIDEQHAGKPIRNIYWGYRAKPSGVASSHKGDIFIKYMTGEMVGVSLKAGAAGTKEPKLNTFVKPIVEWLGETEKYKEIRKYVFDTWYKDIPGMPDTPPENAYTKQQMYSALGAYELDNPRDYNDRYDSVLEYMRTSLIDILSQKPNDTKKWLTEVVAGEQQEVPLVVLKAIESNGTYEIIKDEDEVKACVARSKPGADGISFEKTSNKQNFNVNLTCMAKTTKLSFSIRTSKSGVEHKLGQFTNLAVKFNGIN